MEVQTSLQYFKAVADCIGPNGDGSLGYELSVQSLRSARTCIQTKEEMKGAMDFVNSFLRPMLSMMLVLNPSNIGVTEKRLVNESLECAADILLEMNGKDLFTHLETVALLFDEEQIYYAGALYSQYSNHYSTAGHTTDCIQVKNDIIQRFAHGGLFSTITLYSRSHDEDCLLWAHEKSSYIILKFVNGIACINLFVGEKESSFIAEILRGLSKLTDNEQQLKNDFENVARILNTLRNICECGVDISQPKFKLAQLFHPIWLEFTGKLISSGSIVLKLMAWDQMNELIKEAHKSKPRAKNYIVSGAGAEWVNGSYSFSKYNEIDQSVVYTFFPEHSEDPKIDKLTLSRCKMAKGSRWWWISYADLVSPGTDKDIDFYQKPVTEDKLGDVDLEMTGPPLTEWAVAENSTARGVGPAPTLAPDGLIMNDGMQESEFLVHVLKKYILDSQLIQEVFGPSMHREIVSRCSKMLFFLAELECITMEHLELIWNAAMRTDEATARALFLTLTGLATKLDKELYSGLIDMSTSILSEQHTVDQLNKIVMFAENFDFTIIRLLNEKDERKTLELSWALYSSPHRDEFFKNNEQIVDFLSNCLELNANKIEDILFEKISDCAEVLKSFSSSKKNNNAAVVSRVLNTINFLLSLDIANSNNKVLVEMLESCEFGQVVVTEIYRFTTMTKNGKFSLCSPDFDKQLSLRLNVLRKFYGLCSEINISVQHIEALWNMLNSHPADIENLFAFFEYGRCASQIQFSAFDEGSLLTVFKTYVCSPIVDWSFCGAHSFSCLKFCVERCSSSHEDFSIILITLWRAALNMPSEEHTKASAQLLLKAYDELKATESLYDGKLLDISLEHLRETQVENKNYIIDDGKKQQIKQNNVKASRCVSLIRSAITRSKSILFPPHGVRGQMGRIDVLVKHRKATAWNSHNSSVNEIINSTVDKNSVIAVKLNVHPMQTMTQLIERVKDLANFESRSRISVDVKHIGKIDNRNMFDQLQDFGIVEGSVIIITKISQYNHKTRTMESTLNTHGDEENIFLSYVGQIIATDESKFFCLMDLCDSVDDPSLSKNIWDLLMLIPTQSNLESFLLDSDIINWVEFIGTLPARMTYVLQIIDCLLQPSPELINNESKLLSENFMEKFLSTGGFTCLLNILCTVNPEDGDKQKLTVDVCLHTIRRILDHHQYSSKQTKSADYLDRTENNVLNSKIVLDSLYEEMQSKSEIFVSKLLTAASHAAKKSDSKTVENALATITDLLRFPEVGSHLTSNVQSKRLLASSLRSASKEVRERSAMFAVELGKSQTVAFNWLVEELDTIKSEDSTNIEIFAAVEQLLVEFKDFLDLEKLIRLLLSKLLEYPHRERIGNIEENEKYSLLGYLNLFIKLIEQQPNAVHGRNLEEQLVPVLLSNFLFTMPSAEEDDKVSICETAETRKSVFALLRALMDLGDGSSTNLVIEQVTILLENVDQKSYKIYGRQLSFDQKDPGIKFSGLKNQGCTCYMNSLLQQLFMCKPFRDAIMNTEIKDSLRNTIGNFTDEELVGKSIVINKPASLSSPQRAPMTLKVMEYNSVKKTHQLKFGDKSPFFYQLRNNVASSVRIAQDEEDDKLTEEEKESYLILDQLQRTFCYLQNSKKRFFDPRPLVDACIPLNMNYHVYQQNDVAEFFDKILDKIEIATKRKECESKEVKEDVWNDVIAKKVMNGKVMYQKILRDENSCGHEQNMREEPLTKIELQIRNKDDIHDTLNDYFQSELMDGDNKIDCSVCDKKMATIRRTVLGSLPNSMILHLKRFDLDYETFETVKLNNRMKFPLKINLLRYTREGMESAERKARNNQQDSDLLNQSQDGIDSAPSTPGRTKLSSPRKSPRNLVDKEKEINEPNPADYDYDLHGVLVHAGVAQGGHYYSFARDPENPDKWYRFDDDNVTEFKYSSETIAYECFGGPSNTSDMDRSSNALVLFYSKINSTTEHKVDSPSLPTAPDRNNDKPRSFPELSEDKGEDKSVMPPAPPQKGDKDLYISASHISKRSTGLEAYGREVLYSNIQHVMSQYLLDSDLHEFVRSLLVSEIETAAQNGDSNNFNSLVTFQFCCNFFITVILHCKDRSNIEDWETTMHESFKCCTETTFWFLEKVLLDEECNWLKEYLLRCPDSRSKQSFLKILCSAVKTIAPNNENALTQLITQSAIEICGFCANAKKDVEIGSEDSITTYKTLLCALLAREIHDSVLRAYDNVDVSHELFSFITEIASIPCIRLALVSEELISNICFYVLIESSPEKVKAKYPPSKMIKKNGQNVQQGLTIYDTRTIINPCIEAIAALVNAPQPIKEFLLEDRKIGSKYRLKKKVIGAFECIFSQNAKANLMSEYDLRSYMNKVYGFDDKFSSVQYVSALYDRLTADHNMINIQDFLHYHTQNALKDEKEVWKHLNAFNYGNEINPLSEGNGYIPPKHCLEAFNLPDCCVESLTNSKLYKVIRAFNIPNPYHIAILTKICIYNLELSISLQKAILEDVKNNFLVHDNKYQIQYVIGVLEILWCIPDAYLSERMKDALLNESYGLVTMIESNIINTSRMSEPVSESYIELLRQILEIDVISIMVQAFAAEEPRVYEAMNKTKDDLADASLFSSINYVTVSRAGAPEVNGEYKYYKMLKESAWFTKCSTTTKKIYSLYKYSLEDGGTAWFISETSCKSNGDLIDPGSDGDLDYYFAATTSTDSVPTQDAKWEICSDSYGNDPPPIVEFQCDANVWADDNASTSSMNGNLSSGTSICNSSPTESEDELYSELN